MTRKILVPGHDSVLTKAKFLLALKALEVSAVAAEESINGFAKAVDDVNYTITMPDNCHVKLTNTIDHGWYRKFDKQSKKRNLKR
jgi:hypothetical protein